MLWGMVLKKEFQGSWNFMGEGIQIFFIDWGAGVAYAALLVRGRFVLRLVVIWVSSVS